MIKAGDKVRFLNDVGGGLVVRLIDSRMALVAIEDGFELPVLISELIAVSQSQLSGREAAQEALQQELQRKAEQEADDLEASRKSSLRRFAKNPEPEGVYLAFVPHDQQWLLTGKLDMVLVNHSQYPLLYAVTTADNGVFTNLDFGEMQAFSKTIIETFSREEINLYCKGIVQVLLIADQTKFALLPVHAPYDVKPGRFYKDGSYQPAAVLGEKAILVNLQTITALKTDGRNLDFMKQEPQSDIVAKPIQREKALIDKHYKAVGEAVVDLHIGELIDNIAGLSSHDMFKIQMDYFHKTLNSAIANEYDKVTYIHGVGNGVLKNAIVKALNDFEGLNNRMASMSKFGVGAIEVLITEK